MLLNVSCFKTSERNQCLATRANVPIESSSVDIIEIVLFGYLYLYIIIMVKCIGGFELGLHGFMETMMMYWQSFVDPKLLVLLLSERECC